MSDDPTMQEPTEPTTPPEPKQPVSNPQKGTTVPEAQYKGLQSTYNQLYAQHEDLQKKYQDVVTENEGLKLAQSQTTKSSDDLKKQLSDKDAEISRLTTEGNLKDSQLMRNKVIMTDFSDLSELEAEGLLPQAADEDDFRTKLQKFSETVNKSVSKQVDDKLKGAGAAPVGKKEPPKLDADQIYNRMAVLAGRPGYEEEYQQLHDQWIALQDQS